MRDPRFAEIEGHRPYLMRFALAKLRESQLAEEAVQDALVSALESLPSFSGRSSLRTWLTSILRFKVIDLQRRAVTERARLESTDFADDTHDEGWLDETFDETGHWRAKPQAWANPEASFEQRRFWEAFERCLDGLSDSAGRVFFKREIIGEETDTICKEEGITPANCWVILHRARIGLRTCLEKNWFGERSEHGR